MIICHNVDIFPRSVIKSLWIPSCMLVFSTLPMYIRVKTMRCCTIIREYNQIYYCMACLCVSIISCSYKNPWFFRVPFLIQFKIQCFYDLKIFQDYTLGRWISFDVSVLISDRRTMHFDISTDTMTPHSLPSLRHCSLPFVQLTTTYKWPKFLKQSEASQ